MRFTVNEQVGARIFAARRAACLTQAELGAAVGMAHQTIHKLETGAIRITAEALVAIGAALDLDPAHFFEGVQLHAPARRPETALGRETNRI